MGWEIKDEHVDIAEGVHRIIFENADVRDREGKPVQQHHMVFLKLDTCPYCGYARPTKTPEIDVKEIRKQMLQALNDHHEGLRSYAKLHGVRILDGQAKR